MPVRDSLRLNALRTQIKAGTDALERGDFIEVDDADLGIYLERLTTPAPEATRDRLTSWRNIGGGGTIPAAGTR